MAEWVERDSVGVGPCLEDGEGVFEVLDVVEKALVLGGVEQHGHGLAVAEQVDRVVGGLGDKLAEGGPGLTDGDDLTAVTDMNHGGNAYGACDIVNDPVAPTPRFTALPYATLRLNVA